MHEIKIKVDFDTQQCEVETKGVNLITGDYNTTKFIFEINSEKLDFESLRFEMKSPSKKTVIDRYIENNEITIGDVDENNNPCSVLGEQGFYDFEVVGFTANGKLTSAGGSIWVEEQKVSNENIEIPEPNPLDQINTNLAKLSNVINSMVFAQFDIDLETGDLYALVPNGFEDLNFSINEETGDLEVEIYE